MAQEPTRPFTGAEFLESLRAGREVWIYGERVEDVTTHPAFRNPARMLARLYDALHEPATRAVLTCASEGRPPGSSSAGRRSSLAARPSRTPTSSPIRAPYPSRPRRSR